MSVSPENFQETVKKLVRAHYVSTPAPMLLAQLGLAIEKAAAWPSDRGQRSLKQLILETCNPDLQIVFDKKKPAYVAVVTLEVRAGVEAQIAERSIENLATRVRLEDIAWPVLLAFCVDVQDQPVYVRRTRPFRYVTGAIQNDQVSSYILVEAEYRRPGLRIDNLQQLVLSERRDLESKIQSWAAVHGIEVDQFSKRDQDEKETSALGKTALDRLLAAQPQELAQRVLIPADIAQILSRIR